MPEFDYESLLSRVDGDVQIVQVVIQSFIENEKPSWESIEQAMEQRDAQGLSRAVHKARGALATLGAIEATKIAAKLEQAALDGDMPACEGIWPSFASAWSKLVEELKQRAP